MKTRTKKGTASQKTQDEAPRSKIQQLDDSVSNPPQIFVLPENTSHDARIVSIPNPATSTLNRYFVCPDKGFYEFTRIAAPKRAYRSWLLAPDQTSKADGSSAHGETPATSVGQQGYVLQSPEMMIATPIDPLFLALSALSEGDEVGGMQMFLSLSDYVDKLEEQAAQFKQIMRNDRGQANSLDKVLEARIAAVCDELEAGDEKLYKLSKQKLLDVLVIKARKMVTQGLPASMEERFVKHPLVVPMMSVKREASSLSFASNGDTDDTVTGASQDEASSASISQDTQASSVTNASVSTAATSIAATPTEDPSSAPDNIVHLLRLRTALDFLLRSYVAPSLRKDLGTLLTTCAHSIDFKPLEAHLAHIEKLKRDAQTLRSLSENISRKRGIEDDEEALEKADAKKRKKEQEEFRKKNTSRGVQQLKKADTSGMKKLSSFFTKGAAKKS